MSGKSQTALERYKTRRGADDEAVAKTAPTAIRTPFWKSPHWRWVRLGMLAAILAAVYWYVAPGNPTPVKLSYEIDLARADEGLLTLTLIAEGKLPPQLDLEFPPGVFGDDDNGVHPQAPSAHRILPDGSVGKPLAVDRTENGWRLSTRGADRAGFIYQVNLTQVDGSEQDIRRHISTPVSGGIRAAGFEIFLEPVGVQVDDITVMIHNPLDLPILVPWPALIRGGVARAAVADSVKPVGEAHLGFGQGFQPATGTGPLGGAAGNTDDPTAAVPSNLLFHPRNLEDLNNALLICGNIRTLSAQAKDCSIQLATDQQWLFSDEAAMDLVRRIARTEMGFFGSAPTDQITVLLSTNEVSAEDRFDVYGIHTGSSVLVLMDRATTWGMLEEQAASVIAHEMFHGWLGEAIPQHDPDMLWFTEGATSWYAPRMLTAAGIWTPEHARAILMARLQRDYVESPLLGKMPIADAAAEVMADAQQVRFGYAGGIAACMALDQMLAEQSGIRRPLDLVVRYLYDNADGSPLTAEMLIRAVREVTGVECGYWIDAHVFGKTGLPPVDELI